jgi:erythromycin esterase
MPESPNLTALSGWLRNHAIPLIHLDPDAPLDDLEPLREIIGGARVVSLGENSHLITEFKQMRQRILRFLVERCGFTVLAFEYGFSEGFPTGKGSEFREVIRIGDLAQIS